MRSAWPGHHPRHDAGQLRHFGLRALIPYEIRIPVFILIIAALVTVVDLAFNAFLHELYLVLGIFIPLIVTNCIVLARVEAFAAKNALRARPGTALMMGVGLSVGIALLGGGARTDRPGHAVLRHRDDFRAVRRSRLPAMTIPAS
jgi:hypothetical protein